ncbi:methyltransferase domain-containing protein [Phormidesmis priestleyi]
MSVLKRLKSQIKEQIIDTKIRLGMDVSLRTNDRYVLEEIILPYFAESPACQKVLFIGCGWYTKSYEELFNHKEYWTIEIDPNLKKYGSSRHVIDSLNNLNSHFKHNYFDVIVYNGVFGWGIDTKEDAEIAFEQCFQCLRENGVLVFGWNNVPERCPFPPESCSSWHRFKPYHFPPLAASEYLVPESFQNHTFQFLIKETQA